MLPLNVFCPSRRRIKTKLVVRVGISHLNSTSRVWIHVVIAYSQSHANWHRCLTLLSCLALFGFRLLSFRVKSATDRESFALNLAVLLTCLSAVFASEETDVGGWNTFCVAKPQRFNKSIIVLMNLKGVACHHQLRRYMKVMPACTLLMYGCLTREAWSCKTMFSVTLSLIATETLAFLVVRMPFVLAIFHEDVQRLKVIIQELYRIRPYLRNLEWGLRSLLWQISITEFAHLLHFGLVLHP